MAVTLNKVGFDRAMALVSSGFEVEHESSAWQEAKPNENDQARFLETHTLEEYGSWFLGVNPEADQEDRSKFVYPFGDFNVVHKGALEAAARDAAQKGEAAIKGAADKLLGMLHKK